MEGVWVSWAARVVGVGMARFSHLEIEFRIFPHNLTESG